MATGKTNAAASTGGEWKEVEYTAIRPALIELSESETDAYLALKFEIGVDESIYETDSIEFIGVLQKYWYGAGASVVVGTQTSSYIDPMNFINARVEANYIYFSSVVEGNLIDWYDPRVGDAPTMSPSVRYVKYYIYQ